MGDPRKAADGLIGRALRQLGSGRLYLASDAEVDDATLASMRADVRLSALFEVDLSNQKLGPASARLLAESPKTAGLQVLVLGQNAILDDGAEAIAARAWSGLGQLGLAWTKLGARGLAALARSPGLGHLHSLEIGYQPLGDAAVALLTALPALTSLSVSRTELMGPGARALLEVAVGWLDLSDNPLPEGALTGLTALSRRLRSVSFKQSGLGASDAAVLAGLAAPALRSVDLAMTKLGDAGLSALARAPWLAQLDGLNVSYAGGSGAGLATLREAWGARPGLSPGR